MTNSMKLRSRQANVIRWTARILALIMLVFGLMFYFGYDNPLPFVNPAYTWLENVWLTLVPIVFIGLAVGWKYEKTGGYLIVISLVMGGLVAIGAGQQPPSLFAITLVPAVLFLIVGHNNRRRVS